ncbi:secreted trypsin-like serine protease [Amycolatopsis sulphurea]|uniref:Secreted trypsin-like serine protease n=1 Tax=Amycolatopsis sulphurea TaxID=76022 RepID=A0A2A9FGI8_9PSEU|nr:trypsin-like serine protease [Amycolatopsis sulphurea]PFG49620.1 secreted trypsin-like serine protease [Amycolatopsis sulphurea]
MRKRSFFLAVLCAPVLAVGAAMPAQAIIGGHDSSEDYPFMGSFQPEYPAPPRADGHGCGVEVLAPQWVLTASHCAGKNPTDARTGVPRGWKVRVGSADTTSGGEVAEIDHYYRLATRKDEGGFFSKDVGLFHLRTPVRAKPIRLASATPPVNTPVRIIGWGMTCENPEDGCFPKRLQEADTVVQPPSACQAPTEGELCIGGRDGKPTSANMDSGGPALVRDGKDWAVAGVVSAGGDSSKPTSFTDVTRHADWITKVITGKLVPPDDVIPDVEGVVDLRGCVGSVVRTPASRPQDPALVLTNGHCVEGERPAPGKALVDQPADRPVPIGDPQGYPKVQAKANRLVYATMTGTDVALYRLDSTYGQLAAKGAKVFQLGTAPVKAGAQFTLNNGYEPGSCSAEAVVPHLREGGYQLDNSIRYVTIPACSGGHGTSGSPLVGPDGTTVVGIHNTHNDDGAKCTDDNACEVDADGKETAVKGRSYGQQVAGLAACLTEGSTLDLTRPGCALTGAKPKH